MSRRKNIDVDIDGVIFDAVDHTVCIAKKSDFWFAVSDCLYIPPLSKRTTRLAEAVELILHLALLNSRTELTEPKMRAQSLKIAVRPFIARSLWPECPSPCSVNPHL